MKLLVTGGAGFIGSNFIKYWFNKYPKDYIVNLDKLTYAGHPSSLKDIVGKKNYNFVKGDICDEKLVDKIMGGIDAVVNFAAESHVDRSIIDPDIFVKTNIVGTTVLCRQAVKHHVKRFHHVSTDEVFGTLKLTTSDKFSENSHYDPRSPYSVSKAAADFVVRMYLHTFGLPITITNTSNNYGPYQDPEKLIPRLITNAMDNQPLPVYGDGKNVRDWIHVDDHCSAIDIVLRKGQPGETYLVGVNCEKYNIDIVKTILKIMDKPESLISYVPDRPGHDRRYALDSSKIRRQLGWRSTHDFDIWIITFFSNFNVESFI